MLQAKLHIRFLMFLLVSCLCSIAQAQQPSLSNNGKFTVDFIKGCSTLDVTIQDVPGATSGTITYYLTSESGERLTDNESHRFYQDLNPGKYEIVQIEGSTGTEGQPGYNPPSRDRIKIEVVEPLNPHFEVYNCGNNRVAVKPEPGMYDYYLVKKDASDQGVRVDLQNNTTAYLDFPSPGLNTIIVEGRFNSQGNEVNHDNCGKSEKMVLVETSLEAPAINEVAADIQSKETVIKYTIQPNTFQVLEVQRGGAGGFTPLDTLTGNEVAFTNPETGSNIFCYRITTHNFCDGNLISSEPVCTAVITAAPEDTGNRIEFRTAPSGFLENAVLIKDGTEIYNVSNENTWQYTDTEVNCNTTYLYAIQLEYSQGRSITQNLPVITTINGSLKPAENIISFWENNATVFDVALPFPPGGARYFAHKGSGKPLRSDSSILRLPHAGVNTCYTFSYEDACGNKSLLGNRVCALYLTNTSTQPDVIELIWNEYTGYKEGVAYYVVEKHEAGNQGTQVVYSGPGTSLDLGMQALSESGTAYTVKAVPVNSSLEESSSNQYHFQIVMDAYFPNAFTPDGDGKNDFFKVEGKFVSRCILEIFNSWGELVYRTEDKETGWDGSVKGKAAPHGSYVYNARFTTEDGSENTKRGTVLLFRR